MTDSQEEPPTRNKVEIPHKKLVDRIVFRFVLPGILLAVAITHFTMLPFEQSIFISGLLLFLGWLTWRKRKTKKRR